MTEQSNEDQNVDREHDDQDSEPTLKAPDGGPNGIPSESDDDGAEGKG